MRHLGLALASFAAISVVSSLASAQQEPSSADVSAARALGQEGVKLADSGNCKDAIDKLERSEKLFHAPTTLEKLGECQVQVGKIVDGTENLNRVSRESLAPNAPAAFAQAQERARKLLAEAKPRIAKLKIAVAGPTDNTIVVKLDGNVVPTANLNMNRPADPGEHDVEATAPGYKSARAHVTLQEGGNDSVALTLELDPNAPKPEPVAVPPQPGSTTTQQTTTTQPTSMPRTDESSSRLPAYVALGLGGAGIIVGAITGGIALGKKNNLTDACPNGHCPASARDDYDTGHSLGTVSTVAFIVGGVGLAAGIYLYLTEGSKSSSASSSAILAGPQSLRFRF